MRNMTDNAISYTMNVVHVRSDNDLTYFWHCCLLSIQFGHFICVWLIFSCRLRTVNYERARWRIEARCVAAYTRWCSSFGDSIGVRLAENRSRIPQFVEIQFIMRLTFYSFRERTNKRAKWLSTSIPFPNAFSIVKLPVDEQLFSLAKLAENFHVDI